MFPDAGPSGGLGGSGQPVSQVVPQGNPQQVTAANGSPSTSKVAPAPNNNSSAGATDETSVASDSGGGDDVGASVNFDTTWPDGDVEFQVPSGQSGLSRQGATFHFGWALCCTNTKPVVATGEIRRYLHCLGVFKCPNCNFLGRPMQPKKKTKAALPLPPKRNCPKHPNEVLQHIACRCTLVLDVQDTSAVAKHSGQHNHPCPPIHKPSPAEIKKLQDAVSTNPDAGPAKLRMGVPGRVPMPQVSPAFVNQHRLAHHRRNFLQGQAHAPQANGIRTSTGALFDFAKDLGDMKTTFFKDVCMDHECMSITMQTPSMEEILKQNCGSVQSDTLEGVMQELDFEGNIDLHFTSCFDPICDRWVPVMVSIIFGRSKRHFHRHWTVFFSSFAHCGTWSDFESNFFGATMDWSDALGNAFLEALCDFSRKFPDGNLSEDDAISFMRKCSVHFQRSLTRVARNTAVVKGDDEKEEFLAMADELVSVGIGVR